jgi:hypothetical protein
LAERAIVLWAENHNLTSSNCGPCFPQPIASRSSEVSWDYTITQSAKGGVFVFKNSNVKVIRDFGQVVICCGAKRALVGRW